jgi:diketogulonate reductase-like aldo/keto reductase
MGSMSPPNIHAKFEAFERMLGEAKAKQVPVVLIHHPEVLGDTYAELVENLNKLSDAGLMLRILPRANRKS